MKKRRVVLVDFYWTRDKDPRVPLGHASILTALRACASIDSRSVVLAVNEGVVEPQAVAAQILKEAEGCEWDDVDLAFGAYVWGEGLLQEVLRRIRDAGFGGRIILGGPQISYSGAGLESLYPLADIFVRGYGEEALVSLVSQPERRDVVGAYWAGEPDKCAQASVDLEALPSPWIDGAISLVDQQFVRWETQRGCPFRCTFCQHQEAGARLKRRELDMSRIEKEIALFCASGVRDIAILDPIFNMSPRAPEILNLFLQHGFEGRLSLQCRAEAMNAAFLDAAAQLNVRLEFGLQTIHEDEGGAVKRRNNLPKVDHMLAQVRERDIDHELSIIFGLPHQTLSSFEQTVAWCLERDVPVLKAFPLLLLRGTELDRDREKWGLKDTGGDMQMVYESNSFSREDWMQMARISEALKQTEHSHPKHLDELQRIAAPLEPDELRWIPEAREAAE